MANNFFKLKKEEIIIENMLWPLDESHQALSNSSFNKIPNEILLHIFRYFAVPDLCNISLVCRSFKMIADQDEIWKLKSNTSMKLPSKSYRQIYIEWMHEKSLRNNILTQFKRNHWGRTACIVCPPPSYPKRPESKYRFQSIGGFQQHPNSTQDLTIELSVDIDKITPQLISLLEKTIPFQKEWQESVVLKQMIQRYYRFMQLKASHPPETLLIPTIDIEIVWQTHLLRPEMYRNDCLRLFRRIIDHSLILKNDIEKYFKKQAFLDTCQLYKEKFGEEYCSLSSIEEKNLTTSVYVDYDADDDESIDDKRSVYIYWDETYFKFSSNRPNDYENPFSFTEGDIIIDLKWFDMCKQFMSNALDKVSINSRYSYGKPSGIDLRRGPFKRLKKSYERFLYMAAKYPLKDGHGFIPPTYAIDIIWHSHMQEPLNYESDCLRFVGYVIYHDPWPIIEDEKMKNSSDKVDQIWKDEFQCEINIDHLYNTSDNKDSWFG